MITARCKRCSAEFRMTNQQFHLGQKHCSRKCRKQPIKERFMRFVKETQDCWLWAGCRHGKGYGHFQMGKSVRKAHRISYELFVGQIPPRQQVMHLCDNPPCVNPKHLKTGTNKENMAQREKNGRTAFGLKIPQTKLSDEDVRQLRLLWKDGGLSQKKIAQKFKITLSSAWAIANKKRRERVI